MAGCLKVQSYVICITEKHKVTRTKHIIKNEDNANNTLTGRRVKCERQKMQLLMPSFTHRLRREMNKYVCTLLLRYSVWLFNNNYMVNVSMLLSPKSIL